MNMVNDNTSAEANNKTQALDKVKVHALAGFAPRGIPANAAGNPMASGAVLPGLIEPGHANYVDQGTDCGDEKPKCDCKLGTKKKTTAFKVAVLTGLAVTYIGCCVVAAHATTQGQVIRAEARAEARAVEMGDLAPVVARGVEAESASTTESVCTNSSSTTYPTPSAPIGAATINGAVASAQNMTTAGMDATTTGTGMATTSMDMTTTGNDMATAASDMTTNTDMVTVTESTVTTVATETTTAELSCAATPATTTITVTIAPANAGASASATSGSDTVVSETSTTTATTTVTAGSATTAAGSTTGTGLTTRTSTSTTTRYITINPATANATALTIGSVDPLMGTGTLGTGVGTILATGTGSPAGSNNSSMTYNIPTPSPTTSTFPSAPAAASSTIIVSSDASSGRLLARGPAPREHAVFSRGALARAALVAAVIGAVVLRA